MTVFELCASTPLGNHLVCYNSSDSMLLESFTATMSVTVMLWIPCVVLTFDPHRGRLYGIIVAQTYVYLFNRKFDSPLLQFTVLGVAVTESIHTGFIIQSSLAVVKAMSSERNDVNTIW